MSEDRNSCPRCADYDRVVEEVENLKRERTKEVKSLLDDCEQNRSQLQKKVTTMTVVAAITGAVLGKEFVDSIADYINSFNNATGLNLPTTIGMSTPATTTQPEQDKQDDEKDEEKVDDKQAWEIPSLAGLSTVPFDLDPYFPDVLSVLDEDISYDPQQPSSILARVGMGMVSENIYDEMLYTDFIQSFPPSLIEFSFDSVYPDQFMIEDDPVVIPAPSALAFLLMFPVMRRRRR